MQRQTSPHVREAKSHSALCRSPGRQQTHAQMGEAGKGEERQQRGGKLSSESSGKRAGRSCHSPAHSSDSQHDLHSKAKGTHVKKWDLVIDALAIIYPFLNRSRCDFWCIIYTYLCHFVIKMAGPTFFSIVCLCRAKGSHSSKRHHHSRVVNRQRSVSVSPTPHRRMSGRKKSKSSLQQRSSSWSSVHSSSRSKSREHTQSKTKSPHTRQNNSRYMPPYSQSFLNSVYVCLKVYTYIISHKFTSRQKTHTKINSWISSGAVLINDMKGTPMTGPYNLKINPPTLKCMYNLGFKFQEPYCTVLHFSLARSIFVLKRNRNSLQNIVFFPYRDIPMSRERGHALIITSSVCSYRERDSPHYSDTERTRRRSRSYSPIRKRRRDSPSFMEARRITRYILFLLTL